MASQILSTSDWHLRSGRRLSDFVSAVEQIIAYARENTPDVVLFGGDLFHTATHGPTAGREAARLLTELSAIAPVVGVAGNHDTSRGGSATDPIDIAAPRVKITRTPRTFKVKDMYIVCIPWLREHEIVALAPRVGHKQAQQELGKTIEALLALSLSNIPKNAYKVLVAHCTTLEGVMGGHTPTVLGRNLIWNPDWFYPFDFVSLGHLHMAQTVAHNAVYPGSPERVDFGERDEEKGFYTVELGQSPVFHEVDTRPMVYIRGKPEEVNREIVKVPDGAIVRIVVNLDVGETWYGAETSRFFSVDISKQYPRQRRHRVEVDDVFDLSPQEILALWAKSEGKTDGETNILLDAFQTLLEAENVEDTRT
jgi:exonuclease SbcD